MTTTLTLAEVAHISCAIERTLEKLEKDSISYVELTKIKNKLEAEFLEYHANLFNLNDNKI